MSLLELAECLKSQAIELFPDKIAIITLYGSTCRETDDQFSDLDMFAIVDNKEDTHLPWEFIFQDHTVDFWKMDWKQAEKMASGKQDKSPWAVSAALFANGKILFSRSNFDTLHYNSLITKTKRSKEANFTQIMSNFNSGYSHIEEFKIAKENNDLLSARWSAWQLINKSVRNLSLINNSFLTQNWGANLHEVFLFPILPENFPRLVTALSTTNNFDEMVELGKKLLQGIREIVLKGQENIIMNKKTMGKNSCRNYNSMKAYINKILSACHKKDILAASYAATELQIWIAEDLALNEGNLMVNVDTFNFFEEIKLFYHQLMLPNLMEGISQRDFLIIEKTAKELDIRLQEFCRNQNTRISRFDSIREVQKYLKAK
ncbi:MAG: hypothetical protein ACFFFH_05855 [Candidatus Thorarchaeota archaeon]